MEASVNICYRTLFNIKKKASIACNRSLEYADKLLLFTVGDNERKPEACFKACVHYHPTMEAGQNT